MTEVAPRLIEVPKVCAVPRCSDASLVVGWRQNLWQKSQSIRRKLQSASPAADNIALVLQGHLIAGDVIAQAGLAAQVKTPKKPPQAA